MTREYHAIQSGPYVPPPIIPGSTDAGPPSAPLPAPYPVTRRPRWVMPVIIGLVALVVALGGLVVWTVTEGRPLAGAAAAGPPADGGRYDTPQALIARLEEGGVLCTGYDPVTSPIGAVARGSCYIGGREAVVSVYATTADAQRQPQLHADLLGGLLDVDFVIGLNLTVNCRDQAMAAQVSAVLGGQVVHIPAPGSR